MSDHTEGRLTKSNLHKKVDCMKLFENLKHGIVSLAFSITNIVLRVIYPPKITWEDKKATCEVRGSGKCLLFSNHTGHLDGLYMAVLFKKYKVHTYVARDWYEKKKINWLFRNLPYIPIDRKDMDTSWLDLGVKKLDEGYPVYMFPEGKTSKERLPDEFKPGFLMLAKRAEVPVIPICIDGLFHNFRRIHIIIGKPVSMDLNEEGRPSAVLKKYANVARDKVIELKEKYGI